jgi:uncharacterized membrane protein YkvA (DUF1232 family)
MTTPTPDPRYLELFPAWLRTLGPDSAALALVASGDGPDPLRRYVIAGLNYVFKSLDLIPDGIDDLGYLDDAFVLRVAAALALTDHPEPTGPGADVLSRLAADARAVKDFLGQDYARLESYVEHLRDGAARGRTVDEIMKDPDVRRAFISEVKAWSQSFEAPSFTHDPKTLIRLRSFLNAKLP